MPANPKAAAAVKRLFERNPDASTDEFRKVAERADSSVKDVSNRSFNATYVVPLKRRAGTAKKKTTKGNKRARKATSKRTAKRRTAKSTAASARELVLQRDQEILAALGPDGDPQKAYELASNVDDFVDRIASALRK